MTTTAAKAGYAPVNGLSMYYEIHGTGQPLILLHGGFGLTGMFGEVLPLLAQSRQVIAVDLQAHGRTADIDRPLCLELMGDDIAALIKHLGFNKPTSWATRWAAAPRCGLRSSTPRSFASWWSSRCLSNAMAGTPRWSPA